MPIDAIDSTVPILRIENLRKNYGGTVALQGVDITVQRGEILGLIGPNGSGKSTLFDCCTGLQQADSGRVLLNGQDITRWKMHRIASEGKMVRTFQKTVVLGTMDVEENLVLAGQMAAFSSVLATFSMGRKAASRLRQLRERARALIDISGLTRVAHLPAGQLSGGQQKLLQFAAALMPDPEIVLLDEPLAGINPILIEKVIESIGNANKQLGTTFVVIEHNTDILMELSHRALVLHQGKKLAEGSPADIVANAEVVEAYLGV